MGASVAAVANCPSCGSDLTGAARFCASCGAHVDGGTAVGSDALLEIIDVSGGLGPANTNTTDGARFRWPWAAAAVAVIGLLGWTLTRSSDDPGQVEQLLGQDRESVEDEPEASTTTTRPRPSTSRRPTTTTAVEVPGVAVVEGVAEGQPLLGEPVGLRLYVGGGSLDIIDLDTGSISELPFGESPIGVDGDWLLLRTDSGTLSARSLSQPDLDAITLSGDHWFPFVTIDDPGFAWVIRYADGGTTAEWSSIALADGSVRSTVTLQSSAFFLPSPEIVGTSSGGVFELGDDNATYRRLADGTPLAFSDDYVLVQSCRSPTDCRNYWIDRASGEEADRFVPPSDGQWWSWSAPLGPFLSTQGPNGPVLWDIDRGTEITKVLYNERGEPVVGFSPDGRFAAYATNANDRLVIYDAQSGTSHEINLSSRRAPILGLAFGPATGQP